MNIIIEEADETLFWLEMIEETDSLKENNSNLKNIEFLKKEANELIAIFVASAKTVKKRIN